MTPNGDQGLARRVYRLGRSVRFWLHCLFPCLAAVVARSGTIFMNLEKRR